MKKIIKKIILSTIITGLLFLFLVIKKTFAIELISGASAQLAINTIKETSIIDNKFKIKEIAIRQVLERYHSPLLGQEKAFITTCRQYDLDCYLLPSIAGLESTFGKFIYPNSYNPFGWGQGYIMFSNWEEGIDIVGKGLRKNYLNKGATDVWSIGPIYSESPTWATRVNWFIEQFKKEEEKIPLYSLDFPVQL